MKILTFNARIWTRDTTKREEETYWKNRMKKMTEMIKKYDPDIICFQEMMFPATCYIPKEYKRVGLTTQHPIYIKKDMNYSNHCFRVHLDTATINEDLRIVNVHSHWDKSVNEETNKKIEKEAAKYKKVIACGDFNNSESDIKLPSYTHIPLEPEGQDTFINYTKPEESHGIIDHFYVKGLPTKNVKGMIIMEYGRISDHYPVLMTI